MRLTLAFSILTLASAWVNPSINMGRNPVVRFGAPLHVLADPSNEVSINPDPATSSVELTINVTGEQTKNAYDRVITETSKNIDIPGEFGLHGMIAFRTVARNGLLRCP